MNRPARVPEPDTALAYHAMQIAQQRFGRPLRSLDPQRGATVLAGARTSFDIEERVLGTTEAGRVAVSEQQLDGAIAQIRGRYAGRQDYREDLSRNGLDEHALRQALERELRFNTVMQAVGDAAPAVSEADVRLFYELHHERFQSPESRLARHILVTVNPDFAENTPEHASRRIADLAVQARAQPHRFQQLARRHSECPTAIDGGRLGAVTRGQLYPSLDRVLFAMQAGSVSDVVESEMGLHLLYCESIQPPQRVAFRRVEPRIRTLLQKRLRQQHMKQWLARLEPTQRARLTERRRNG